MLSVESVFATEQGTLDKSTLRHVISQHYMVDEERYLAELIEQLPAEVPTLQQISAQAQALATKVRHHSQKGERVDAFLQQYSLNTQEGIILMCLAEALLRIPDRHTADELIKDKLSGADWAQYFRQSSSTLVNASTWGLMLTGKVVRLDKTIDGHPASLLNRMINRLGEPVVRSAMNSAMKLMGKQFVLGRTIDEAIRASHKAQSKGYSHSYDMLGEAALTADDAQRYFNDYAHAIEAVGKEPSDHCGMRSSVSIKLSALHPRYQEANRKRVMSELYEAVLRLLTRARAFNVPLTIDAEEMDRLELSLDLFSALYHSEANQGWGGLGIVVQAYAKRALPVLAWLTVLAKEQGDTIAVRLVKGAYWDSEIKHSQQLGLAGYPVFTRKAGTDVAYLVCARYLLSAATQEALYPQFATHNAHTVMAIMAMAQDRAYEFQRLHGMGAELYQVLLSEHPKLACRIYAPVGAHKDLLPYLVRRLLENGANNSFVHKLMDPNIAIEKLCKHPLLKLAQSTSLANVQIPLPADIFSDRKNSRGLNMNIECMREPFFTKLDQLYTHDWHGGPVINGQRLTSTPIHKIVSPQNINQEVGLVHFADGTMIETAITHAVSAFPTWRNTPVAERAAIIERLGDLLEEHSAEFISLCTREAGKLLQDGIDEVREAVDFCRYYANQARQLMIPITLPGYTGESNLLLTQGRGPFVCISPWNFPLAIFIGQVSAALVTGNTVLAKPAPQTNLIAYLATILAHEAGVPAKALQLLLGEGHTVGAALVADPRIAGVCFTGSHASAQQINHTLAQRSGAIIPLIAETGGQNAMIVDSSALPEQVVQDIIRGAFQSAGQRCSALRVLYLQEEIADPILTMLKGAMQELKVGDPAHWSTDVGPVIDKAAQENLQAHIEKIQRAGHTLLAQTALPHSIPEGFYIAPSAFTINSISELAEEQFGPILHIVRFNAKALDTVIDDINATGYGLTLGIHSRNAAFAEYLAKHLAVGNVYINRDQIGAMVGVQPFGGQGLSGTGPKAGGPLYLTRFVTEKTITNNTSAIGGNAGLLSLDDE